jgi:ribosomal protein S3
MLRIHELIEEKIRAHLKEKIIKEDELKITIDKVYKRKLNPYRIASKIAKGIIKSRNHQ